MLTLAINTASQESAVALIHEGVLLGEVSWESAANESKKVIPSAEKILKEADKAWQDLTHVFVVKGPGSYTSLRVGISIANALAWQLNIPLITTDVYAIWKHRIDPQVENPLIAVAAGRDFYIIEGEDGRFTAEELSERSQPMYGELPGANKPAFTFGQALTSIKIEELESVKSVEPLYNAPPNITKPKGA